MTDILQCLESRGCDHLLTLILSLLPSPDLSSCALVSRRWRRLVEELVWGNQGVRGRLQGNKESGHYRSSELSLGRCLHSLQLCHLRHLIINVVFSYGRIIECGLHLLGGGTSNIFTLWLLHLEEARLELEEWCLLQRWVNVRRGEEVLCRDKGGSHITLMMMSINNMHSIQVSTCLCFVSAVVRIYQEKVLMTSPVWTTDTRSWPWASHQARSHCISL